MGDGWTSERRCTEISTARTYRPDGLIELRTDVENNYNTVCVTTENDPSCRIVFTVPPVKIRLQPVIVFSKPHSRR